MIADGHSFLPLDPQQCETLASKYHVYMLTSGRINVSGLNPMNIERLSTALDKVARNMPSRL